MEKITLFYKYVPIDQPNQIMAWQKKVCQELGLKGRIILATEGINGTLGGSRESIASYEAAMTEHPLFGGIDFKHSPGSVEDFPRLRIVVKDEIVRLDLDKELFNVTGGGAHLTPQQAHELISAKPEDLIILDGRNDYESRIGAFTGAIKPPVQNFRDFPAYIDQQAEQFKDKTVLMYCTGGIRCERASAYLKSKGTAKQVLQISGGIQRYLEQFPDGHFRGKNYVFDARIAMKTNDDILSSCDTCETPYDDYSNCVNMRCNKQILSCDVCTHKFTNTCGERCAELVTTHQVAVRRLARKRSCQAEAPQNLAAE